MLTPGPPIRGRPNIATWTQAFGRPPLSIEVEKQSEEIIIISPIMSALKEGMEAQERELEAATPAPPPASSRPRPPFDGPPLSIEVAVASDAGWAGSSGAAGGRRWGL
jgi:hypothetical protein